MFIKTVSTASGINPIKFDETGGVFYWILNTGSSTVYASTKATFTAGDDGVVSLGPKESRRLETNNDTIYILGEGQVEIHNQRDGICSFKQAPTSSGGGETIDAYTKTESDAKYAAKSDVPDAYTKSESDAKYAQKTDVVPYKMGMDFGMCTSAAETTVKSVTTQHKVAPTLGAVFAVQFNNAVPAKASLNINGLMGDIQYRGANIPNGVINAGDIVTFMYHSSSEGNVFDVISVENNENAKTVNGFAVGCNVPADAVFTDTMPNLLINGDFQLNQSEKPTYNTDWEYTVNRWQAFGHTMNVTASGITITTRDDAEYCSIMQQNTIVGLSGKTITYSMKINGTIYSGSTKITADTTLGGRINDLIRVEIYYGLSDNIFRVQLYFEKGTTYTIEWIKVEIGHRATQFLPSIHDLELQKIQGFPTQTNGSIFAYADAINDMRSEFTWRSWNPTDGPIGSGGDFVVHGYKIEPGVIHLIAYQFSNRKIYTAIKYGSTWDNTWEEIFTSNNKPYVTGTFTVEVSDTAQIIEVPLTFNPSVVLLFHRTSTVTAPRQIILTALSSTEYKIKIGVASFGDLSTGFEAIIDSWAGVTSAIEYIAYK